MRSINNDNERETQLLLPIKVSSKPISAHPFFTIQGHWLSLSTIAGFLSPSEQLIFRLVQKQFFEAVNSHYYGKSSDFREDAQSLPPFLGYFLIRKLLKNDKIAPFPGSDNTSLALITALLTSDQRDQTIAVLKNEMGLYKNYFPVVCAISITFLSFAITALIFTFLKIAATPSSSSLGNSCCIDSCLFDSCSKIACSIILTDQAASEAWLSGRSEQQSYDWAVKQCLKYSSSCDSRMISGNDAGGISILCDTDINKLFSYLGAAALTVVLGCIGTLPIIRGVNKRHFQLLHKLDNKASTDLHRFFKNNANLIPVATPGATAVTIAP